jgi:hypothetical protein
MRGDMTLTQSMSEQAADGDAQALFEEARRRRRKRWIVGALFLAIAVSATAVAISTSGNGGNNSAGHHASGQGNAHGAPADQYSTSGRAAPAVVLPAHYSFTAMSTSEGRLLLTGTTSSTKLRPPCVAAPVNPVSLKIGKVIEGNCDNPALSGTTVAPVFSEVPHAGGSGVDSTVAIARLNPVTHQVSIGPVIMTYGQSSDSDAVVASADGWLWIYDVASANGPEVLQISDATGQVTNTASTPLLYRPIAAANVDGLWLGNTVQGGELSSALWHVAPGADSAVAVPGPPASTQQYKAGVGVRTFAVYAAWLAASGDHLWAGIGPTYTQQTIWGFVGSGATVVFHTPERGFDPTVVVGGEASGLFSVGPYPPFGSAIVTRARAQDVIRIDPADGAETVLATLKPTPVSITGVLATGQVAYFDGSLFVIENDGPQGNGYNGYVGFKELVGVRVDGGRAGPR